jgi:hypothetical protein
MHEDFPERQRTFTAQLEGVDRDVDTANALSGRWAGVCVFGCVRLGVGVGVDLCQTCLQSFLSSRLA